MTNQVVNALKMKVGHLENFQASDELTVLRVKLEQYVEGEDSKLLEEEYKTLLVPFAEPGEGNRTLLMRAAANAKTSGYLELMEDLLAVPGIQVDEETDGLSGEAGITALLLAVKSRVPKAVQLLVIAGARVDTTPVTNVFGFSFNETPLSIAEKNKDTQIVDLLQDAAMRAKKVNLVIYSLGINYGPQNIVHPESKQINTNDSLNPNSRLF